MFDLELMRKPGATIFNCFSTRSIYRLPVALTIVLFWCSLVPARQSQTQQQESGATQPVIAQPSPSSSPPPVFLESSPTLIIDPPADTQKGTLLLLNTAQQTVDVLLKNDVVFVNTTTKTVMPARVTFTFANSPILNRFPIKKGQSVSVGVTVSNVQGEGEAEAPLINDLTGAQIGVLRIRRTPFDVALDVPLVIGENTQKLDFKRGTSTSLVLKNNNFAPYKVRWMMVVNGEKYCGEKTPQKRWSDWWSRESWGDWFSHWFGSSQSNFCEKWGEVNIPPNSKRSVEFTPPGQWFPRYFQSIFKEDVQASRLRLRLEPFDEGGMRGTLSPLAEKFLPEKEIPFTANLAFYSPNTQLISSTIVIGFILVLGGAFSLVVRNWIPNQLRKQDFKEQLAKLAVRTGSLSSQINSNLRVLVRLEPKRLTNLLKSRVIISPDMATVFTQCEKGIKSLERRVGILETIDSTYDRLDTLWASCPPPSLIDKVEQLLSKASQFLRCNDPSEFDFEAAKTLVAEAGLYCDKINASDDKFAGYLNAKIASLKLGFAGDDSLKSTGTYPRIHGVLPGPFKILKEKKEKQENGNVPSIESDDYTTLDISVLALTMIREYILLYENSSDAELRKGLDDHESEFVKHLGLQSREQLSKARSLLRQMREGIYTTDIEEAIKHKEIAIEMDPPIAREQHPVRFTARFKRSELNDSAARDNFDCVWDFGTAHELMDKGRLWRRSSPPPPNDSGHSLDSSDTKKSPATIADAPNPGVQISSPNNRLDENGDRLIERGWSVSHYFVHNTTHHISAWFEDASGKTIGGNENKLILGRSVTPTLDPSAQSRDRLKTEAASLAIVLVVALLGLITGAREQVLKLDIVPGLVTVFLLGFSADAIKNLLTQRSS